MLSVICFKKSGRTNTHRKYQGGYNLLQMSIAILIVGILVAPLAALYTNYQREKRATLTYENVSNAVAAMQNYRTLTGAYPCPSAINVPKSNPAYGTATDCTGGAVGAAAPGTCTQGVCVEQSIRTLPAPLADPRIIVGAIPFRLLQLDEGRTLDGYGNRLFYAITASQTQNTLFNDHSGGITIRDDTGASLTEPEGAGMFVVFSAGQNKKGAYNADGVLNSPCAGGLDAENCNVGFELGTFAPADSIYISTFRNDNTVVNTFDDIVMHFTSINDPLWKKTDSDPDNINDLSPNFVGIGTQTPTAELDLSAVSYSSATDALKVFGTGGTGGKIMADVICDENGANCFNTSLLGSPGSATTCSVGEYVVRIENGDVVCAPIEVKCTAALPVFKGLTAAGAPICAAIPGASCPAQAVNRCGTGDIMLPATSDTQITPYIASSHPGSCLASRYKCNNGTFVLNATRPGSTCAMVPVTTTTGISCGPGHGGATYSTTTTRTCNTSNSTVVSASTTNTTATDCGCVGAVVTDSYSCSPTFTNSTGSIIRTITYAPRPGFPHICDATTVLDTSACACAAPVGPSPKWVANGTCLSPMVAGPSGPPKKEQAYNSTLGACNWVDTGNTMGGCVCGLTTTVEARDALCADPVCEKPDAFNQATFEITHNPATCAPTGETMLTAGSCTNKSFKWQASTAIGTGSKDINIGDPCSCTEHKNGNIKICSSPDSPGSLYRCLCNP